MNGHSPLRGPDDPGDIVHWPPEGKGGRIDNRLVSTGGSEN